MKLDILCGSSFLSGFGSTCESAPATLWRKGQAFPKPLLGKTKPTTAKTLDTEKQQELV